MKQPCLHMIFGLLAWLVAYSTAIDHCLLKPCYHGTCSRNPQGFRCMCDKGYTGATCITMIDNCLSNPCIHGTCYNIPGAFRCTCNHGYSGTTCATAIDHCQPNPCIHGTCSNNTGTFRCTCNQGYTGSTCNTVSSLLCQPLSAPAHGTIVCGSGFPFYSCFASCDKGYEFPSGTVSDKRDCDQMFGEWFDPPGRHIPDCAPIDHCQHNPCIHGTCSNTSGTFRCTCNQGYTGSTCNTVSSLLCQPLSAPAHGTIVCGSGFPFYSCFASCDNGYVFPSGTMSDKRDCDQMFGEWFDPPGRHIPDCVQSVLISQPPIVG